MRAGYLAVATEAVLEAGALQRESYEKQFEISKKGVIDLVTEVDRRCEDAILRRLRSAFPGHDIVTEESQRTQELQNDFKGQCKASATESASGFSAVGFFFGRYLHQILGVPVGLIDNAWGGSAAEAWIRRESLEKDPRFKLLMENTVKREEYLASDKAKADLEAQLDKWRKAAEQAKAEGKAPPRRPQTADQWLTGNARPGNIFCGVLRTPPWVMASRA